MTSRHRVVSATAAAVLFAGLVQAHRLPETLATAFLASAALLVLAAMLCAAAAWLLLGLPVAALRGVDPAAAFNRLRYLSLRRCTLADDLTFLICGWWRSIRDRCALWFAAGHSCCPITANSSTQQFVGHTCPAAARLLNQQVEQLLCSGCLYVIASPLNTYVQRGIRLRALMLRVTRLSCSASHTIPGAGGPDQLAGPARYLPAFYRCFTTLNTSSFMTQYRLMCNSFTGFVARNDT